MSLASRNISKGDLKCLYAFEGRKLRVYSVLPTRSGHSGRDTFTLTADAAWEVAHLLVEEDGTLLTCALVDLRVARVGGGESERRVG